MSDDIDKMIHNTTVELENSKRVLQELANEVTSLVDIVQPALEKQIAALRSARMSTVNEIRESLVALREIRKFFLEDDYAREMEQLERFVAVCKLLQELKAQGVLDAVADVAIKLALK